jgi:hypothetical protein
MKTFLSSVLFLCLTLSQAHSAKPAKQMASATDITSDDTIPTTFVISNETPGYLIDQLVARGYGDSSLYAVMQYLQPLSGGAIPQWFIDSLAACPAGSEIFTSYCSSFAYETNNPIGINSDGTLIVVDIYGRDYYTKEGYETFSNESAGSGKIRFTSAASSLYYIDTGCSSSTYDGGYINSTSYYYAFAIAWADSATTTAISTLNKTDDSFILYPNPATDKVTVSINGTEGSLSLSLYDIFGRLVMKKQISADEQLDISSLPAGVYFVSIETENRQNLAVKKLLKY